MGKPEGRCEGGLHCEHETYKFAKTRLGSIYEIALCSKDNEKCDYERLKVCPLRKESRLDGSYSLEYLDDWHREAMGEFD